MNQYRRVRGVTLIELLVTLTVAAILLGVAVPSFTNLIVSNRAVAQTSLFVNALNYARSEAVKRGQFVYVRPPSGSTDWTQGWQIFVKASTNLDSTFQTGDTLLRTQGAFTGNANLTSASQNNSISYVGFNGLGGLLTDANLFGSNNTGTNTELQFSFTVAGRTDLTKTISINRIGRVTIQ
jgi:type IV fimbrial biogenesis protein FimT